MQNVSWTLYGVSGIVFMLFSCYIYFKIKCLKNGVLRCFTDSKKTGDTVMKLEQIEPKQKEVRIRMG